MSDALVRSDHFALVIDLEMRGLLWKACITSPPDDMLWRVWGTCHAITRHGALRKATAIAVMHLKGLESAKRVCYAETEWLKRETDRLTALGIDRIKVEEMALDTLRSKETQ